MQTPSALGHCEPNYDMKLVTSCNILISSVLLTGGMFTRVSGCFRLQVLDSAVAEIVQDCTQNTHTQIACSVGYKAVHRKVSSGVTGHARRISIEAPWNQHRNFRPAVDYGWAQGTVKTNSFPTSSWSTGTEMPSPSFPSTENLDGCWVQWDGPNMTNIPGLVNLQTANENMAIKTSFIVEVAMKIEHMVIFSIVNS